MATKPKTPKTRHFRWAVGLKGHQFDLADARALFAVDYRFRVTGITGPTGTPATVLMADELEQETSENAVQIRAGRLVDLLNAALFLRDAARQPVESDGAIFEWDQGRQDWRRHICVRLVGVAARGRAGNITATAVRADGSAVPQPPPTPSDAQRWALAAVADDPVADVLSYLRGQPDWFNLYKAFEAVRDDVSARAKAPKRSKPTKKKNRRGPPIWVETILGGDKDEAQNLYQNCNWHRHHKAETPARMLTIEEARGQLATLVKLWLAWRK